MKTEQDRFFEAVFRDDVCVVRSAIEGGVDPNAKHAAAGTTPLEVACEAGAYATARVLLGAGVDPNLKFSKSSLVTGNKHVNRVALMYAKTVPLVDLLVEAGAEVNAVDDEGWTALSLAVRDGYFEVVERLIRHGASLELAGALRSRYESLQALVEEQRSHVENMVRKGSNPKLEAMLSDYSRVRELLGVDSKMAKLSPQARS